ncbi:hypothetical protein CFR73_01705 [Novacetimonas maltaceti]|uniref:Uncharacterized protein n=1 Tax=Novacetimonas maltaceti TaxID=1203393 RepID=A0A2S3W215_9PROT|nr:hypothetical protein [Novacetimonas maltaceti]POF62925.1 hypothetical protein KMAL_14250 [Novacetimonas maltaceti]PYD61775.1 hypothetical protein CFR73_01705 [Novacetimonas maltaceti]
MSVLSSPQGSPERVWSLLVGLQALGGTASSEIYKALLSPVVDSSLVNDTRGVISSLGLVRTSGHEVSLIDGLDLADMASFADDVYDRLIALELDNIDAVLLTTYAWICARSDREGNVSWLYVLTRQQFADQAAQAQGQAGTESPRINATKLNAWYRWLVFMGMGESLPLPKSQILFSPAQRLRRELQRARARLPDEMTADAFRGFIASRLPYLDGGRFFTEACAWIGHAPPARQFSPMLSDALRDLHDDGTLRLCLSGDAMTHIGLTENPAHAINAFTTVRVNGGQEQ